MGLGRIPRQHAVRLKHGPSGRYLPDEADNAAGLKRLIEALLEIDKIDFKERFGQAEYTAHLGR